MPVFKNIIAPIQSWLLGRGQCVGCGAPLNRGQVNTAKIADHDQVTCKCGRIFMFNRKTKQYRRALFEEV